MPINNTVVTCISKISVRNRVCYSCTHNNVLLEVYQWVFLSSTYPTCICLTSLYACALIIGNILYAVSYTAWLLLVAELLIGLYLGSYLTLSYSYSIDSSIEYSHLQQENNKTTHSERESSKMRDLLFGIEGIGRGIGFFVQVLIKS